MHEPIKISESEMEVMKVFWSNRGWLSLNDLRGHLSEKSWKYNTIGTFVLRLVEKGVLACKKQGKTNYYSPLVSEEDYKKAETQYFLKEIHGGSMKSLLASLADTTLSPEDIDELADWVKRQ